MAGSDRRNLRPAVVAGGVGGGGCDLGLYIQTYIYNFVIILIYIVTLNLWVCIYFVNF